MTADGPLSVGSGAARGRCVRQRPDDAESVQKLRALERERAAAEAVMSRYPAELGYDAWRAVFDEPGGCGAVMADPESTAGGTGKC